VGPPGNRRAPVHAAVTYGMAELRPDPSRPRGWTLLVDGVPQSYVDLDDPGHLEFPYVRLLGRVVRAWAAGGVRPRVLHLGGGGLTLPRLLDHLRPGLPQRLVERDPSLITLVTRFLPFPDAIEVTVGDAWTEMRAASLGAYDLILADVFGGAAMPATVGSAAFASAAAGALRPGGLLAMNLTDVPPLAHTRIRAATVATAFRDVALLGDSAVIRGRRAGNVILLAGDIPVIRMGRHERAVRGADLAEFIGGAKPRLDEPT
jgi:hypothetical protein